MFLGLQFVLLQVENVVIRAWVCSFFCPKLRMSSCVDGDFGFAVSLAQRLERCHRALTVILGFQFLLLQVENVVIVR